MPQYHVPRVNPLPTRSAHLEAEARRIELAAQAFLAGGGEIEQVGYQMSDAPTTFVINPERTPVYAHLFQAPAGEVDAPQAEPASDLEAKQAAQIMARAALGEPPKWIAKQLHMTEKRVRQLARDYHISFRAQR
ncbi:hypothetical protein [Pseudomonas sp. NPDC079086]|uniref:hypothetical protein n=1 Tax=unclassified Pseudomonas TaxID=196821 RepID=UPI0037CAA3B1